MAARLLVLGPLIKDRKTEGDRVFEARPQAGLRARARGRRAARPGRRAPRSTSTSGTRSRSSWTGSSSATRTRTAARSAPDNPNPDRVAPRGLGGDRAAPGRGRHGRGARGPRRVRGAALLRSSTAAPSTAPRSTSWSRARFSFNSPHGACPACTGLGVRLEFDPARVIPDRTKSVAEGAMVPWRSIPTELSWRLKTTEAVFKAHGWDVRTPIQDLPPEAWTTCSTPQGGREGRRQVPPRPGRELLRRHLRGRHHQPRAALPRDGLGVHQDRAREVHGRAAVPHLRGKRLKPEVLARHRRRPDHRGRQPASSVTDALTWAERPGGRLSEREQTIARARCSRRSAPAWASSSTSASTT